AEKLALSGALAEEEDDPEKAREAWQSVKRQAAKEPADRPWDLLAGERLQILDEVDDYTRKLPGRIEAARKTNQDFQIKFAWEPKVLDAIHAEIAGDLAKAREAWLEVKKKAESIPEDHGIFLLATRKVR